MLETTVAGSLPKPPWLAEPGKLWPAWRLAGERLSEAEREALYKAVYESDHWKTKIAPRVPQCLDRSAMVVTRIVPTPKSTAQ